MSWDSKNGELIKKDESEEFMNFIIGCLNTTYGKTTTYKFGLIKSILDNLFNIDFDDYKLTFNELSYTFCKMYWNLVSKYQLPQKQGKSDDDKSSIEILIYDLISKYSLINNVDFDSLNEKCKEIYLKDGYKIFKKYVVGALYSDFKGKIYGFDKKKEFIYFSRESYDFLVMNKNVIEKVNYYSWILWTEKLLDSWNKGTNNVGIKLDNSTKRNSLLEFKNELFGKDDKICFYCGKTISFKNCHIDHFIPWVFVKDDKIWNLVISCNKCNLSKNDKIPSMFYLNKLLDRNKRILNINYEEKITYLYKSALFNGYKKWDYLI